MVMLATAANAACMRPEKRLPTEWAADIIASASVILDAEVVQQESFDAARPAILRPLTIYKGKVEELYTMALPKPDGIIVTERYVGLSSKQGEHLFLALDQTTGGYEMDICYTSLFNNAEIRSAVIRNLRLSNSPPERPLDHLAHP